MKKLALLVCLALACNRAPVEEPPEPAAAPKIEPDLDADNLLNMAWGAAVVSRTGELNLDNSAAHAIDSIIGSSWISSPGAPDETAVFSLLSPARVSRVGITTTQGDQYPRRIAFDASMDGREWRELIAVEPQNHNERQLWPVPETTARYIRVRSLEKQRYYVRARVLHAIGAEVAPPETPPFTGCWIVNGERALLRQDGARITGTIESDPPTHLEGGTDNRVALLTWQQGAAWGYAALTRTPDGSRLTGIRFFTDFEIKWLGDGWFGERCTPPVILRPVGGEGPSGGQQRRSFAVYAAQDDTGSRRSRSVYPLYGLAFDANGGVIEQLSRAQLDDLVALLGTKRARLVSYEVRGDTPEENRKQSAARIASLRAVLQARGVDVSRIEFVAAGSDWNGPIIRSTIQRLLASRVELSFGT